MAEKTRYEFRCTALESIDISTLNVKQDIHSKSFFFKFCDNSSLFNFLVTKISTLPSEKMSSTNLNFTTIDK